MTFIKIIRFILVLSIIVSAFFIQNKQTAIKAQERELENELTIPVDCDTLSEALTRVAENGTVFLEERTKLVVNSPIEISKNVSVIGKGLLKSTVEFKDAGAIRVKIEDPDASGIKPAEVSSNDEVKFPETVFNTKMNVVFRNINFEKEGKFNKTIDDEYERLVQEKNVLIEHGVDSSISHEQIANEIVNYLADENSVNFLNRIKGDISRILAEKKDYLLSIESGYVSVTDCALSNRNGVGILVSGSNSCLVAENSVFGNNYVGGIFVQDSKMSARYCIFSKSLGSAIISETSKIFLYFCKIKDSGQSGIHAVDDSVVGLVETGVSGNICNGIRCDRGTTLYLSGGEFNNATTLVRADAHCHINIEGAQFSQALVHLALSGHCNCIVVRSSLGNCRFTFEAQRHCVMTFEKKTMQIKVPDAPYDLGSTVLMPDEVDSPPVLTLLEEALSH